MRWTIAVHHAARDEIEGLPAEIKARLRRTLDLVADEGVEALPPKSVKYLIDGLWELGLMGRDQIARALWFKRTGPTLAIVRVHQEDAKDTAERNPFGAASRSGDLE